MRQDGFLAPRSRPALVVLLLMVVCFTLAEGLRLDLKDPVGTIGDAGGDVLRALGTSFRRSLARYFFLRADQFSHTDAAGTRVFQQMMEGQERTLRVSFFQQSREVVPALELAIRLDPTLTEAAALLGSRLGVEPGREIDAVRHLQTAILGNPRHPQQYRLYAVIGRIYWNMQRWFPARNYYRRALDRFPLVFDQELCEEFDVEPDQQDDFYGRSAATFLVGAAFRARDYQGASLALDRLLRLQPDFNLANSPMGQFLMAWRGDPGIATPEFDPVEYLEEAAKRGNPGPASGESGPAQAEGGRVRQLARVIDPGLHPAFVRKLMVLAVLPTLVLLLLVGRRMRRS